MKRSSPSNQHVAARSQIRPSSASGSSRTFLQRVDALHPLLARLTGSGQFLNKRFYEKVIKVKADVAAFLNLFSDVGIDGRW